MIKADVDWIAIYTTTIREHEADALDFEQNGQPERASQSRYHAQRMRDALDALQAGQAALAVEPQ